jgi:hypothetical protein
MREKIKDGGPMFPQSVDLGPSEARFPIIMQRGGMSLRDYFAAEAMQALIQAHAVYCPMCNKDRKSGDEYHTNFENADAFGICSEASGFDENDKECIWADKISKDSFGMADAMLKVREVKP